MWNLKPEERLHEWRCFRTKLGDLSVDLALKETCHLWSYAPYVTHYLLPDLKDEWPDPWTLVHENMYCDLAKALGMLYTVYLSPHYNHGITNPEIRIYKDIENHDVYNVVWTNRGKYILNLMFDTVVNKTSITENLVLKYKYTVEDLNLNLY
jgi:hypothetical protein